MCTDLAASKRSKSPEQPCASSDGPPSRAVVVGAGGPPSTWASPPTSSASLEPLETSDDLLRVQSRHQHRVHHLHQPERSRIIDALARGDTPELRGAAAALANCCRTPIVYTTESGRLATRAGWCRSRVCPMCAKLREAESGRRSVKLCERMDSPRFITLTLREDGRPLVERLDRLAAAWRKLRQQKCWKQAVRGGIYGVQVTRGAGGDGWHVHMHVIADGTYFHHSTLRQAWATATGDSTIVDIRAVPSRSQVATYIARYICNANAVSRWDAAAIREYVAAFKGRRTLHTFGDAHGKVIDDVEEPEPSDVVECEVPLAEIEDRAREGCERSSQTLCVLKRSGWVSRRLLTPPGSHPPSTPRAEVTPWEQAEAMRLVEDLHIAREEFLTRTHGRPKPRRTEPSDVREATR